MFYLSYCELINHLCIRSMTLYKQLSGFFFLPKCALSSSWNLLLYIKNNLIVLPNAQSFRLLGAYQCRHHHASVQRFCSHEVGYLWHISNFVPRLNCCWVFTNHFMYLIIKGCPPQLYGVFMVWICCERFLPSELCLFIVPLVNNSPPLQSLNFDRWLPFFWTESWLCHFPSQSVILYTAYAIPYGLRKKRSQSQLILSAGWGTVWTGCQSITEQPYTLLFTVTGTHSGCFFVVRLYDGEFLFLKLASPPVRTQMITRLLLYIYIYINIAFFPFFFNVAHTQLLFIEKTWLSGD